MSDKERKLTPEDEAEDKEISVVESQEEIQAENQAENQTDNANDEKSGDEKSGDEKSGEIMSDEKGLKSGQSRAFSFILLILICGLAAGGYTLWDELQQTKSELAEVANSGQTQTGLMAGNLAVMDDAIRQLEGKQIEQSDALASLYQDKRGSNEDWAIAEVEYLLIIAMQRLLLEEDVTTALAAMEAADLRLKNMGNPGLLPVRQQLAADMNQLRSVNLADTVGMAIYLADMVDLSADLPLKSGVIVATKDQSSADANPSDDEPVVDPLWKRIPKILWHEIKSLVVIKRSGEVKQALLLPGEEYFLYQNLRLELESARQAVLRSDSQNLRSSIDLVLPWIRKYFDTSDSAVINVMETLDKMRSVELKPELPDISSSLESLRAYIREIDSEPPVADDTQ
ncbi:MAG: uroporphyrinogen-III C-methyltransferase [Gammaproteobacteria bacterium]|nr:uroporphyrinogen-III C-methyltransferase [Gammaproteobacteria bacterium]